MSEHQNTPTAVVYDIFTERSGDLIAWYTRLSDNATEPAEREQWWSKALQVRDTKRAIPAHDREQILAQLTRWTAELDVLKAAE
ncbi:hypothetical protein ACJ6WD_35475 [Streptomyces sp. VTCC 41912]|uniref:hypothetical protein n=1 Tax=Streptomyces sp. VTCC 41912 TaxID=3383243 RepID=UPI003896C3DA